MYSLWKEPWLLTDQGPISPQELLADPARHRDLAHGSPLLDAALLRLLILMRARPGAEALDLFGKRAFLQQPLSLTEALPNTPVHALNQHVATGRDTTLLAKTFDTAPRAHTPAETARLLTTFQLFATSRGLSIWNPTKDNPAARSVVFHAQGRDLGKTLDLNTPDELQHETAFWEEEHSPEAWQKGETVPMTVGRTHAFPWRTITLMPEEDGQSVRWIKQSSGVVPGPPPGPWPDVHTLGEVIPAQEQEKRGGSHDRLRNPQSREVQGALVQALLATLNGEALAPLSFRRALELGAVSVRATAMITRSGEPVIQNITEAELPWPPDRELATEALELARDGLYNAAQAARYNFSRAGHEISMTEVLQGQLSQDYWQRLWPELGRYLAGESDFDTFTQATEAAIQNSVWGNTQTPPPSRGSLFISELLEQNPKFALDLEKTKPKSSSVRIYNKLLGSARGGERQAGELMVKIFGRHQQHQAGTEITEMLARAYLNGKITRTQVEKLFGAQRHDLPRLLPPLLKQLSEDPFDFEALYQQLIYYRPQTWQQWQQNFEKNIPSDTPSKE